jgi:hypothetical protein
LSINFDNITSLSIAFNNTGHPWEKEDKVYIVYNHNDYNNQLALFYRKRENRYAFCTVETEYLFGNVYILKLLEVISLKDIIDILPEDLVDLIIFNLDIFANRGPKRNL